MASIGTPRDALIVIGVGLVATVYFARPAVRAFRARRWPTAQATVAEASISTRSRSYVTSYYLTVRYRYEVDAAPFTCDRFSFAEKSVRYRLRALADMMRTRFAPGTTVTICYDPDDPTDAVIDPTVPWPWRIALAISLVFLGLGVTALLRLLAS